MDLKREMAVTALIVDGDPRFRDLVRRVLGEAVRVMGVTDSVEEAIRLAEAARPQVVLMDVGAPEIDGVAPARRIKAVAPRAKVILLTAHDEETYLSATGKSGADAFLPKRLVRMELLSTIRSMAGVATTPGWDGTERRRRSQPGRA